MTDVPFTSRPVPPGTGRIRYRDWVTELVAYWWNRKLFIATVMVSAICIFVIALLLIPKRYRAEATLIVLPPRFTSEVRTEPLSITAVRTLLKSEGLIQGIVDTIRITKGRLLEAAARAPGPDDYQKWASASVEDLTAQFGPEIGEYVSTLSSSELKAIIEWNDKELESVTIQDLSESLESEEIVEKKTAADVKLSPLVMLYATADAGTRAQLLVNTWAFVFEQMYDSLTTTKTHTQYESINNQQQESELALSDIMTTIVRFKEEHNLELYDRMTREHSANYAEFTNQLLAKTHALEAAKKRLAELTEIVGAIEEDGQWVGRVQFSAASIGLDESTTASASLLLPADDVSTETLAEKVVMAAQLLAEQEQEEIPVEHIAERTTGVLRQKAVKSRIMLEGLLAASAEFYATNPIQTMEREVQQAQTDFDRASSRLRESQIRRDVLRKHISATDERLSATERLLVLNTGVPEENIAEAVTSPRAADAVALSQLRFQREEINPAWQELQSEQIKRRSELDQTENEVVTLTAMLPEAEMRLRQLQTELYTAKLRERVVNENLAKLQVANQELYQKYIQATHNMYDTAEQVRLLGEEVRQLDEDASKTLAMLLSYQQRYDAGEAQLQQLEGRRKAIQTNTELLLQKFQEAQIAVQESVSDVSIASRAVAPEKHFFPPRTILLATLTLLTLVVLLGGLARRRYLEIHHAY